MLSNYFSILFDQKPSWENVAQGRNIMIRVVRTQWSSSGPNLTSSQSLLLSYTDVKVLCWALGTWRSSHVEWDERLGCWRNDWAASEQRLKVPRWHPEATTTPVSDSHLDFWRNHLGICVIRLLLSMYMSNFQMSVDFFKGKVDKCKTAFHILFRMTEIHFKIYTERLEALSQCCVHLVNLWRGLNCTDDGCYCNCRQHSWS